MEKTMGEKDDMHYSSIIEGRFLSRPNRFIAYCEIAGRQEICHVKNTGRCKELLIPGVKVFLQHTPSPTRKTGYDLIGVDKNGVLVNIDSQAPNKAVGEWLPTFLGSDSMIFPEHRFGDSRIDFYAECDNRRVLMEVKGVTLEVDGVAMFPDAPTARGVRHLKELTRAAGEGYDCYVMFVIQMDGVGRFCPNVSTDPAFAEALRQADKAGVHILAYDCDVTPDTMTIRRPVPIYLE